MPAHVTVHAVVRREGTARGRMAVRSAPLPPREAAKLFHELRALGHQVRVDGWRWGVVPDWMRELEERRESSCLTLFPSATDTARAA